MGRHLDLFDSVGGYGLGGFVSFVVAVLNVVAGQLATPLKGGGSHSPPVGKGGNVDDSVLCVGGGYGGCCFYNWISYDEFVYPAYSFVKKVGFLVRAPVTVTEPHLARLLCGRLYYYLQLDSSI